MSQSFETVRAEALFASPLQSSEVTNSEQVRRAVAATLRRIGIGGCAAAVSGEFGDHPDTAVPRMCWALATIHSVYPRHEAQPAGPILLALAC